MKKGLLLLTCTLLLASCSGAPSGDAIGTAVAQTLAAQITPTNTSVPATNTPEPTSIPTITNTPQPTKTNLPMPTRRPTVNTQPPPIYILETGWCMLDVTIEQVNGKDPKTVQWCNLDACEQIQLASNQTATITINNLDGKIQVYCALFSLDGTFIMSDMGTTGSGKVTCSPKL